MSGIIEIATEPNFDHGVIDGQPPLLAINQDIRFRCLDGASDGAKTQATRHA
jgi:hypothetical protein